MNQEPSFLERPKFGSWLSGRQLVEVVRVIPLPTLHAYASGDGVAETDETNETDKLCAVGLFPGDHMISTSAADEGVGSSSMAGSHPIPPRAIPPWAHAMQYDGTGRMGSDAGSDASRADIPGSKQPGSNQPGSNQPGSRPDALAEDGLETRSPLHRVAAGSAVGSGDLAARRPAGWDPAGRDLGTPSDDPPSRDRDLESLRPPPPSADRRVETERVRVVDPAQRAAAIELAQAQARLPNWGRGCLIRGVRCGGGEGGGVEQCRECDGDRTPHPVPLPRTLSLSPATSSPRTAPRPSTLHLSTFPAP